MEQEVYRPIDERKNNKNYSINIKGRKQKKIEINKF